MRSDDKGAAAVEFALVLPILLVLVMGIMEFGYLAYVNASAAGAAREGARTMAITEDTGEAEDAVRSYFVMAGATPTIIIGSCTSSQSVEVKVSYTYDSLTGWFGSNLTAHGTGKMRCGG